MSDNKVKALRAIIEKVINEDIKEDRKLERLKLWACRKFGLSKVPSNSEILEIVPEEDRDKVLPILGRKPVRSISGVTVITVMPKPHECPKDEPCIYCPGGPESGTPQSYTGEEPASARALELGYDPTKQIKARIKQLHAIGHDVDKIELIIFGGTFLAQPIEYKEKFIHKCIDAISGIKSPNLEVAKKKAEKANRRTVGITFETRPDYCMIKHVNQILKFGGTRVEVGVQTIYEDIYELINREHTLKNVIEATKVTKDYGLSIVYHMMPGLPGSNVERDLKAFETIFNDSQFKPDMLKIYPCLVTKNTELYEWWKSGRFNPIGDEEAIELITKIKNKIPRWVRIQRIQRDIPSHLIEAGVRKGNLRDLVKERLDSLKLNCKCIRCREVGHKAREGIEPSIDDVKLLREVYKASNGTELFLSFEDVSKEILLGYLRLRIPSMDLNRPIIGKSTPIVRMLYVLGDLVPVGENENPEAWQHKGWGQKLLSEAERIIREEYDMEKIAVISGLGTRPYYRRFGYILKDPYMVKELD